MIKRIVVLAVVSLASACSSDEGSLDAAVDAAGADGVTADAPAGEAPQIKSITPTIFKAGEDGTLTAVVIAPAGETISYEWTATTSGSFSPASGEMEVGGGGQVSVPTSYTAPATPGLYNYRFTVANEAGQERFLEFSLQVT